MMDLRVSSAAWQLRQAIEMRSDGELTGPAVQELVSALGGDPYLITEFAGKPSLTAAYLVSLVLSKPE